MRRFLLAVLLTWGIPIAAASFFSSRAGTNEANQLWQSRDEARFSPIGKREDTATQPAMLQLDWSDSRRVIAPDREGTVTAIEMNVGQKPRSGDLAVLINQRRIVFQVGGVPLFRDLRLGDHGPDVQGLASVLSGALGRPIASAGDVVDATLAEAVRDFNLIQGLQQDYFSSADVVYLPARAELSEVSVQIGQHVSRGDVLAATTVELQTARLILTGASGRQGLLANTPLTVQMPSGAQINVSGLTPAGSELPMISQLVPDKSQTNIDNVSVSLRDAVAFGSLPSSAIVTDPSGTSCVFVRTRDGGVEASLIDAVEAAASAEPGIAYAPASLIGKSVLVNPSSWPHSLSCSS